MEYTQQLAHSQAGGGQTLMLLSSFHVSFMFALEKKQGQRRTVTLECSFQMFKPTNSYLVLGCRGEAFVFNKFTQRGLTQSRFQMGAAFYLVVREGRARSCRGA